MRAATLLCLSGMVPSVSADIVFTGLDSAQEANVRALTPLANTHCDSAPWRVKRLFRDANEHISGALEALGYYRASISKSLEWREGCFHAAFDIDPGLPVTLRTVKSRIEGMAADDTLLQNSLKVNSPLPGDILNHGRYEKYKNALLQAALARGYFDAAYSDNRVVVNREEMNADTVLIMKSGPRYTVGDLTFSQGIIQDNILRAYSDFSSGDPYSEDGINEMLGALRSSGYFDSVYISTEPLDRTNKTVPVNVYLEPGSRRVYTAGAGYASDIGPVARLGYINRRRNERGHQFESRLMASPVKSEVTATYRWPKRDPRKEWLSIAAGFQHEDTDTSSNDSYKLGLRQTLSRTKDWLETRYIDYTTEDFKISNQSDRSQLVILGFNWESVQGRGLSRADQGRRLSFDILGASDALGSDTSFMQVRANAKWVRSLNNRTRLLSRAQAGFTWAESLLELPVSVRFFAGGDRSIRGYDYKSLGPIDSSGAVSGGTHLLEASLEIERLIRGQWAAAAFIDSGSAYNDSSPDFSTGIGLGLRWYSPIGPIRLDFAHPLDKDGNGLRIHLVFGPDL
jgi:translocation and assembly module TamA